MLAGCWKLTELLKTPQVLSVGTTATLPSAGAVGSAARGASAPAEGGEGRRHIVAAARLQLVSIRLKWVPMTGKFQVAFQCITGHRPAIAVCVCFCVGAAITTWNTRICSTRCGWSQSRSCRSVTETSCHTRTAVAPLPSAPASWYVMMMMMIKVKVHTLDIAPLRSESPPQKRSGMS